MRVVDLGANRGLFTVLAAKKGARILAIDAQAGFESELRRNLERNDIPDETVSWQTALVGSRSGVLSDPATLAAASHVGSTLPEVGTFETLLDRIGFDGVDLLKMDIEGAEYALFDEAPQWLPRVKAIAMEVHEQGGSPKRITSLLRAEGFCVRFRQRSGQEKPEATGEGIIHAWRQQHCPKALP